MLIGKEAMHRGIAKDKARRVLYIHVAQKMVRINAFAFATTTYVRELFSEPHSLWLRRWRRDFLLQIG
jgi:hypothetical protein